jgi:hypothetical protein
MLNRRYSHQAAARVASPIVATVGVVGGILASLTIPASPPLIVNVILWGVVGVATGYLVFASEGPQKRPASVVQASIADGVVAGILTALTGGLVDVISASGAGSASGGALSLAGAVLVLVLAIAFGALSGAGAGALALTVGGRERFTRVPATRARTSRAGKGATAGRPARKSARKRTKR